ncbi:MAG: GntR family transcriptional regulator [Desertifilum sp.]|nr:GntR family transcriptional regulator [Desertifilum sp.]
MQPKHPLLQKCLTQLEALPHLGVKIEVKEMPYVSNNVMADGLMSVGTAQGSVNYVVEIKSSVTRESLRSVLGYFDELKQRLDNNYTPLLIAEKLSSSVVNQLIQANIQFLDSTGNFYLNSPSLYLLTSNPLLAKYKPNQSLNITAGTLQVMYGILQSQSTIISRTFVEELAEISGVDLKTVNSSLNRLSQLRYLQRQPGGGYRLVDDIKFLERWELGYIETLRPKLLLGTYTPILGQSFFDIKNSILERAQQERYLIGGELGGEISTGYLKSMGATLHLSEDANPISLSLKLKIKPDLQGKIYLLRQFGNCNQWGKESINSLVNPLLIHAELMLIESDERIKETNQRLFNQYLIH